MSVKMITIASFDTPTHASLLRMRLEQEGIPCVLANEQYNSVARGLASGSAGATGVWLQVREQDAERAQQILQEASAATNAMDDAELEQQAEAFLQCPECHSEEVEYQESATGFVGTCAACGHRWELA